MHRGIIKHKTLKSTTTPSSSPSHLAIHQVAHQSVLDLDLVDKVVAMAVPLDAVDLGIVDNLVLGGSVDEEGVVDNVEVVEVVGCVVIVN